MIYTNEYDHITTKFIGLNTRKINMYIFSSISFLLLL